MEHRTHALDISKWQAVLHCSCVSFFIITSAPPSTQLFSSNGAMPSTTIFGRNDSAVTIGATTPVVERMCLNLVWRSSTLAALMSSSCCSLLKPTPPFRCWSAELRIFSPTGGIRTRRHVFFSTVVNQTFTSESEDDSMSRASRFAHLLPQINRSIVPTSSILPVPVLAPLKRACVLVWLLVTSSTFLVASFGIVLLVSLILNGG